VLRRRGHPADRDRIRVLLDEAERLGRDLGMQMVLALSALVRGDESGAGVAIPPPRGSTFRRDGEIWTITHGGELLHLKDAKGLHYLAHLLTHPGRDVHVLDLVAVATHSDDADARRYLKTADAGEVLDGQARAAYRARLAELREELDQAEQFADRGRIERTRGEIEFLTEQLASAVGLGGRERRTGQASERARAAARSARSPTPSPHCNRCWPTASAPARTAATSRPRTRASIGCAETWRLRWCRTPTSARIRPRARARRSPRNARRPRP